MPVTQRVSGEATERQWNNPCHLLRPNPLLYVLSVFSLCSHTADPPLYSHSQAETLWLNSHHPFSLLCSPSHLLYLKYPVLYFYDALSSLPSLRPPTVFHFTLLPEEGYSYAVPGRTPFDGRRMLGLSLSNSLEGTEFKLLQSIGNVFCAASSDKTHWALLYEVSWSWLSVSCSSARVPYGPVHEQREDRRSRGLACPVCKFAFTNTALHPFPCIHVWDFTYSSKNSQMVCASKAFIFMNTWKQNAHCFRRPAAHHSPVG